MGYEGGMKFPSGPFFFWGVFNYLALGAMEFGWSREESDSY